MKVDGLAVVLAIILLPIILVVTFYIQMQVDTISTENSYNTKLLDATYDAMSAFEINTANEELSSVADSMRSIVLASNNVLLNTLATNLGISNASQELLKPYIPAVLYTMYDGYYIYAPTETSRVAEKKETKKTESGDELITTNGYVSVGDEGTENLNGTYGDIVYEKEDGTYTVNKDEAKKDTDYVLKSYIQYSGRYQNQKNNIDVTINYTLDNYLNIVGNVGDIYYTKTGYLIKKGLVNEIDIRQNQGEAGYEISIENTNETDIKNRILGKKTNAEETTIKAVDGAKIVLEVDGETMDITSEWPQKLKDNNIFTVSEAEEWLEKNEDENNDVLYQIQNYKAIAYYASSACFSNWVYNNLKDLTYGDIKDNVMENYYREHAENYKSSSGIGESDLYYDFHNESISANKIFDENQDPENIESNFYVHKLEVIKNSIKYNLNLSISTYCKMRSSNEYSLPVLLDEEWDKILNNISIVTFMQGWDCGLDIYNNYQIASSTNNELTVTPTEIYYVEKNNFNRGDKPDVYNQNIDYHRIDCPELVSGEYISFKSKEVKYDKVLSGNSYKYDHKNLACYTCINTNNYDSEMDLSKKSYYERINTLEDNDKKIAGYIGIAKERQDIYKTNALPVSEGYRIYDNPTNLTAINLKNAKGLQITIANTKSNNAANVSREPILQLKICNSKVVNFVADQKTSQTVSIDISDLQNAIMNVEKILPKYDVDYSIKSIKVIYK